MQKYMNNGAACCANSLFMQIVAACSYFPLDERIRTSVRAKTGEQKYAESTRSRLVRWSRRRHPTTTPSCNSREQNQFDLLSGRSVSLLLQRLQRAERQLLSETRLNFSTLKICFSSLTAVEPKAQSGRSLFFHYRTLLSGPPPKKDLACQTASAATERSASALV